MNNKFSIVTRYVEFGPGAAPEQYILDRENHGLGYKLMEELRKADTPLVVRFHREVIRDITFPNQYPECSAHAWVEIEMVQHTPVYIPVHKYTTVESWLLRAVGRIKRLFHLK